MEKLSFIIPIHQYDKSIEEYLSRLIKSIDLQKLGSGQILPKVFIVHDPKIKELSKLNSDKAKINLLPNTSGDTCYQAQVNFAVKNIETEFFSVLEFDDEIGDTYVSNVYKHINVMGNNTEGFMPMIIETDSENQALKFTNEPVWSQQFVGDKGEIGYLSEELLKEYSDFKLSGAVLNKQSFLSIGGYKTKIKLTFMYEFLLRAINNGFKLYTIPKIIYKHLIGREGSMFDDYLKNMPIDERKFWFETAQSECMFTKDRDVVYQPQTLSNPEKVEYK